MTDHDEIDVETLRTELDQIKGAMGLKERYPSQFRLWLVYGVLVFLAALGSQAVVTFELPDWGHSVAWFGFIGIGALYEWLVLDDHETSGEAKPNIRLQGVAIAGFLVATFVIVGPLLEGAGDLETTSTIFALILGTVGTYYIVAGSSMAAYYVRARDRYAFYIGGAWILAYAAVMPRIGLLQEWGYAVFGVLFALHAVGSYVALSE